MNEDSSNHLTDTLANLESYLVNATLPKDRDAEEDTRASIYVRSFRRLNRDPDGVSVKAALDGIVERGILADDSSKQIKSITFETFKSPDEKTVIIIESAE